MSFTAQYHGECPDCGQEMKGTEVGYQGEDLKHTKCPEGLPDETMGRHERKCGECFQIHAGECA